MAEKPRKDARRGLGRGLSALMADVNAAEETVQTENPRRPDRMLPIESLVPNPDQPRRTFTQDQLNELAASIRTKGVIQPLIVRPSPRDEGKFEIVAGERRWRASQLAQQHEVPVLIREFDDIEVLEVAIIENIQRADLNAIEEAAGYRQLMFKFGHTQEKLAEALGKSRSHIANLMRLLNLPETVQELVTEGQLSAGHARALITAPNPEVLAKTVVEKGLSVRDTEKLVKQDSPESKPRKKAPEGAFKMDKDADTRALEGDLSAALGMKVLIDHKPGQDAGRLTISYDTLEQLDALCGLLSTSR
ncbi:ParB/RepB/Spo0J family partition protein [Mameliella alba]|nr:ParB/RepB/Spo0J family partition protein [Antarctobacter heliothermus]MBY6142641.1 ParB/RepB/Spo0J family partition protein [Mameliella alba]MBY6159496.1 ParB/RepB/Spo0J family partition protein [Mameliella alba]MBY6167967.1 ParB/RepB/Spo0J family partition protein [Mameliella alba]MBY6172988.1 ParB/RepB/Spo0J family partition protein [Mameliella alba]